jgi:hypothetical protein
VVRAAAAVEAGPIWDSKSAARGDDGAGEDEEDEGIVIVKFDACDDDDDAGIGCPGVLNACSDNNMAGNG